MKNPWNLPKRQILIQETERGCSVPVFAQLAGISTNDLKRELPGAILGQVTVNEWIVWLEGKGFAVLKRDGCPVDIVPCVHLVAHSPQSELDFHWVYRDTEGDVHDPSPVSTCMGADDPRMRDLSFYETKQLTISVEGYSAASSSAGSSIGPTEASV
ncbi:hypothetical protein [Acidicapsa acidisoli]|uniref:hypothetical protein n=1 Tax=Acidicapsa acidisoli TaxID=1615681 RepID=UPI0021E06FF1|nr:hypothetical protein [Acidicapsa acidisoli]